MDPRKPILEYHTVRPEDRNPRFIEKLNPYATPRSVARAAVAGCAFAPRAKV